MTRTWARRLLVGALLCVGPRTSWASPPPEPASEAAETATLRGRVREVGSSRAPVSGAVVMVVDAPADVRPGKPATDPLDPESVAWMHRAETDAEGRFELPEVPLGTLRVIVVAGGYARLEQWAALEASGGEIELHVEPERDGAYRTVVVTERRDVALEVSPSHRLDGQTARHYPGSGDDPLLAALNLPGTARSPAGLGMFAFRGGDPTQVGVYVDGHPVPRGFHIIPVAAVLSPPMIASLEISPGNYAASYGGFGGGLVSIDSRAGKREGVHGEAHLDLFDVGGTIEGQIGDGSIHLGMRRSHVGDILRLLPLAQTIAPNYWDYLGRFDYPLGGGHAVGVRALGAGDRLLLADYFDMRASFHRFDLEYRFASKRWRVLLSPSLRLDRSELEGGPPVRRNARVFSLRAAFRVQPRAWLAVDFGADAVVEAWRRYDGAPSYTDAWGDEFSNDARSSKGSQARVGFWLALPMRLGDWSTSLGLRLNLFAYGDHSLARFDPRVRVRGPLSSPVRLLGAAGLYAIPVVGQRGLGSSGYFKQGGTFAGGVAEVPEYLVGYFNPSIDGEALDDSVRATQVAHASLGFEADLPWELELRALGFFRGSKAVTTPGATPPGAVYPEPPSLYGARRSMGLELLLRRTLASGRLEGWLGYTLLWARVEDAEHGWLPAVFDQRHNLVALLSVALPRGVRFGARFRLSSGNPMVPVTGRDIVERPDGTVAWVPLRAPRGTTYQPLFHQLDLRVDKTWVLDRTSVGAYLDVQNVYNRAYPEIWIYSNDWSTRQQALGMPIYPSVGVQVRY